MQVAETAYQYDANGNITNDGEYTYSYDARNRLIQVSSLSGVKGSYLFNANNMRVRKTTEKGTTLYGWDNDRIFAEYDEFGNAVQETVYFGSTPIALLKDEKTYRIYTDQIDTPRMITESQTSQALWAWSSKSFGESKPNEDVDGNQVALNYNLRFPGQYYDEETGKHYNFNRDYDPVTGRYVQSDPIGLDGGMNSFGYVMFNPLIFQDSSGLRLNWDWSLNSVVTRIRDWSFEGSNMFYRLKNDNVDHYIFDKSFQEVGPRGLGPSIPSATDQNFKNMYIDTGVAQGYVTTDVVQRGFWIFKWTENICRTASINRRVAHEMAHAAYRLSNENAIIQIENNVMFEVEDSTDRADGNHNGCTP